MRLASILLGCGIAHGAVASAVPLEKRANNGVYLANCATRGTEWYYSEMDYYNNARTGSQNGQLPDDHAWPSTTGGTPNQVTWEGKQLCGTYSDTGATFCSSIASGAQSLNTGDYAGSGWNNYGATFSCYKDNGRQLYNVPEGSQRQHTCYSIYYCFQN